MSEIKIDEQAPDRLPKEAWTAANLGAGVNAADAAAITRGSTGAEIALMYPIYPAPLNEIADLEMTAGLPISGDRLTKLYRELTGHTVSGPFGIRNRRSIWNGVAA